MKTKFIVASTIGLLGVTSMVIGAITLADNEFSGQNMGRSQLGSGQWMMKKADNIMKQFASTGEAEAFRTEVETAITNGDYTAFTAIHAKYKVNTSVTQEQFTEMLARRATQEKIKNALTNGDYTTWKVLNKDTPILTKIDTEAKFKQLQEMHTYQEKSRTIREELGLQGNRGEGMGIGMGMGGEHMERGNFRKGGKGMGMGLKDGSGANQ